MSVVTTLYKVTDLDGAAFHGGSGKWVKGRWRSARGAIEPCHNGLHLCRRQDLIGWLGPVIWEAEYDGEIIEARDKVVARRARVVRRLDAWNERIARLFAADCAERVLPILEKQNPNDDRPRKAIEAARAFASGAIERQELDAARYAARDAARDAARYAAWDAARSAAWDAARDAAWDAARDAARSAARDAARDAARYAARDAARDAAWDAARYAAWDAARSAFNDWATDRLFFYLDGGAS